MRRWAGLVLVVTLVAAACSDDGGASTTTSSTTTSSTTTTSTTSTTTTTTIPGPSCATPITVTSTEEMVAALEGLEWNAVGPYSSGNLPMTPDLIVEGTVTLTGDDILLPDWCEGDCELVTLSWPVGLDGIEASGEIGTSAAVLTISDTTVRLRPLVYDYHPLPVTWGPSVSVLPACGSPCDAGLMMCPLDGACYSAEGFCLRCDQNTAAECACRTPDGLKAEGDGCQVYISNDQILLGTCRAGVCDAG